MSRWDSLAYYPGGQAFFLGLFPNPGTRPDLSHQKTNLPLNRVKKRLVQGQRHDKYNKYKRLSSFWLPTSDISENTLYHQSPEKSTKPKESKSRNTLLMLFFKAYSFFIVFFFFTKSDQNIPPPPHL